MKVAGNEYLFLIEPETTQVRAEVYKVVELTNGPNGEISMARKRFGNKWFGEPTKEDYVHAREWAEHQLQNIYFANKKENEKDTPKENNKLSTFQQKIKEVIKKEKKNRQSVETFCSDQNLSG